MNWKIAALIGGGAVLLAAGFGAQRMRKHYDEPSHEVVHSDRDFEIRAYDRRVVAETTVDSADWEQSTSAGFERLAGFIFGKNTTESGESTEIAMTTPVESIPAGPREHVIVFTMPTKWQAEALPRPKDERVVIREMPPATVATLRFSGRAGDADLAALSEDLLRRVEARGYAPASPVKIAQYDPPWVLGPLRRNELMVEVEPLA